MKRIADENGISFMAEGSNVDDIRESVYKRFTDLGFKFVTIDMKGYRLGSMNATLNNGK